MKRKAAIIGSNGQLGSELVNRFGDVYQVFSLTHSDLEIADAGQVKSCLGEIKPDIILNTAAYHHVPKCEEHPDTAFNVNAIGALNLARFAADVDATLVHFSTDYVFDGLLKRPYIESDEPNPLNIYALTKLNGETLIKNNHLKHIIIRISGIYGKVVCRAKGGNFITTMLKAANERDVVRVVRDEILTPTPVDEIAENTYQLLSGDNYGLYHMTCEGECSWYEFAQEIFRQLKLSTPLEAATVADFPSPVKRPHYSVLENQNLKKIACNTMPYWRDALINYLRMNFV